MTNADPIRSSTTTGWPMLARRTHHHYRTLLVLLGALCAVLCLASAAQAAGPALTVSVTHHPNPVMRGDIDAEFEVSVTNSGDAPVGGPVSATLAPLPPGLQLRLLPATGTNSVCPSVQSVHDGAPLTCISNPALAPGETQTMIVGTLSVASDAASSLTVSATASGGGVSTATADDTYSVIDRPPFGITSFVARSLTASGEDDTIAGHHPYEATSSFTFPEYHGDTGYPGQPLPVEDVRNIWVQLPPGFVGAAAAAPRCRLSQLQAGIFNPLCPSGSRVGTLALTNLGGTIIKPFFNMVPEKGYPAEFAFRFGTQAVVSYPQSACARWWIRAQRHRSRRGPLAHPRCLRDLVGGAVAAQRCGRPGDPVLVESVGLLRCPADIADPCRLVAVSGSDGV